MNCPKCNAPVREGAKFCTSCGQRIAPAEESKPVAEATTTEVPVENSPLGDHSRDLNEVKGRIYWNIQPGQVARVIDEAELDLFGKITGIIIQEGTTAYIRANGATIASISGGVYDFSSADKKAVSGMNEGGNFLLKLFQSKKSDKEEDPYIRQQKAIFDSARKGAAFSVVILLDKAFPLVIGAKQSGIDDYNEFVPMTIRTAHVDVKVGVNAYFRITDHEKFIRHYLSGQKILNTAHIVDNISDTVRTSVQDVLGDVDIPAGPLSKDLCSRIKESVNTVAPELFFGLSMVRIVEISAANDDLERFRALGREMYLSEAELDYLKRTNDFKNRMAAVMADQQVNVAMSELDIRKRLDEVNKDGLLHENEIERFKHFLQNEQAVRLAKNDDERDAALAELAKTELLRQDELDEIKERVAQGRYSRETAFQLMQLKDGIEFERVRMEGEAEKAAMIVRQELELAGLRDDYADSRFYKELDKQRAAASAGLDIEQRKRDMDFEDARRRHELEKEDDEAQFQRFMEMQRMAEDAKNNERRHEAEMEQARLRSAEEMERMKWEGARELSDDKVWALSGGEAAAAYATSRNNARAEREATDRLEAQRREFESRLDAERASRDEDNRQNQANMFQMMRDVINMAGGVQAQKKEDQERLMREKDERILRQEGRMDTAYDRALDYATRNNRQAAANTQPQSPAPASPAAEFKCPECGASFKEETRYCPDCGAEIR